MCTKKQTLSGLFFCVGRVRDSGCVCRSSTTDVVPLPLKGKDKTRSKMGVTYNVGRDTYHIAASEALPHRRREFPFAKRNLPSPMRGRGTAIAVDEVRGSRGRRHCNSTFRNNTLTPLSTLHSPLSLRGPAAVRSLSAGTPCSAAASGSRRRSLHCNRRA